MLARAHKKFQRGQHSEIYLLTLKKQDKTKVELPLDMASISAFSCRTMILDIKIITNYNWKTVFNFRSFQENIPPDNSEISSCSEKDIFQQKFSVAVHGSQPLLLCSDGYMVTIFQFNAKSDYSQMITDLTKDVSRFLLNESAPELEQTSGNLSAQGAAAVSPLMAKVGKDVNSSPGSTLSETAAGRPNN